ncbi:hypothetical protein BC830DRAFT_1138250 [Chytriomyces sp. MP71]|nr:hypothetical protein BC830DRAFT_1138250 [Chytriomyces sp. MP71]
MIHLKFRFASGNKLVQIVFAGLGWVNWRTNPADVVDAKNTEKYALCRHRFCQFVVNDAKGGAEFEAVPENVHRICDDGKSTLLLRRDHVGLDAVGEEIELEEREGIQLRNEIDAALEERLLR